MSPRPKQKVIPMTPEQARAHKLALRQKASGQKLSIVSNFMSFMVGSIMSGFAGFGSSNAGAVKAARSPELVAKLHANAQEKRQARQRRNILNAMRMGLMTWPEGHPRRR